MLEYIEWMGTNASPLLKQLSHKLCMLLALTRPSQSADLVALQIDRCQFSPEGVTFLPAALAKQSRQRKTLTEYFFPSFPHNRELCPVATLQQYINVTSSLRPEGTAKLFVATKATQSSILINYRSMAKGYSTAGRDRHRDLWRLLSLRGLIIISSS